MICRPRAGAGLFIMLFFLWLTGPLWAGSSSVTVFFDGRKVTVDGIARDDVFYYPVDQLANVGGVRYNWNANSKVLDINGVRPRVEPLVIGGQAFLPLEAFVDASGLVATWDLGRGTLMLNRSSDKMPTANQGMRTAGAPGDHQDPREMPFDASLAGRLPVGWHHPNPLENTAPPPGMATSKSPNTALLDRKQNGSTDVYLPRSGSNGAFLVTITDVERVDNLRGYFQPKGGHRFVIVYLSQKNVSGVAQVDPGKFYVQDGGGNNYEALDDLSSHRPVIFRPYGINFGYLVYELPEFNSPSRLILTTVGQAPLSVNL